MKLSSAHFNPKTIRHHPDLGGKVAVVTGRSRGVGAATAKALGKNGVSIAVAGRDQKAIDFTVESIVSEEGRAIGVDMIAQRSGVIITMSSAAARQAAKSSAAYAAAKSGVIALSRLLAGEFAKDGIRINCIAPSAIENDHMPSWVPEEQRESLASTFPLGRLGQPGDIAAASLFLASSASSWITGVTLDIAGGKVML